MAIDRIAPKALKSPLEDRVRQAASLWERIEAPYTSAADRSEEDAIALALTRDAEIALGKVTALSHSELTSQLRK
ncbi:hypothetical protein OAF27_01155 [Verrucomicrobiales bacterium]|nr:hypothetical protein [Verrucomicrobiales bacterium]